MKNQDFKISIKLVWALVAGNIVLTIVALLAKLLYWEFSQAMLAAGLMIFLSTWIIILADILKQKVHNRSFWLLYMFFLPSVTPVLYLIRRNKLIGKNS